MKKIVEIVLILVCLGWFALFMIYPYVWNSRNSEILDWTLYLSALLSYSYLEFAQEKKDHKFLYFVFFAEILVSLFVPRLWCLLYGIPADLGELKDQGHVLWSYGFNGFVILVLIIPLAIELVAGKINNFNKKEQTE